LVADFWIKGSPISEQIPAAKIMPIPLILVKNAPWVWLRIRAVSFSRYSMFSTRQQ